MNVLEAVEHCSSVLETKKVESPRLSAEILVAHATSLTRSQVLSSANRPMTNSEDSKLQAILQRRSHHEPIPYIIGEVEFYSIQFSISNGVFIPRPETETLVDATLAIAKTLGDTPKIYDLCTGSGNVLISLAMNMEYGEFWGTDVSNMAIQVASINVRRYELQNYVELREGPIFNPMRSALSTGFDILVSNPPYIKSNDIAKLSPQIKDHEPVIALDGGREGLTFIRSLLDGAGPILKPGGYILLEADPDQMMPIRTEVRRRRFEDFVVHNDASGNERVCQFRVPGGRK